MSLEKVIEYCESRLEKPKPLNGQYWIAGYEYALRRILGIAKTGKIFDDTCQSREDIIKHLKNLEIKYNAELKDYYMNIDDLTTRIKKVTKELRKLAEEKEHEGCNSGITEIG